MEILVNFHDRTFLVKSGNNKEIFKYVEELTGISLDSTTYVAEILDTKFKKFRELNLQETAPETSELRIRKME